MGRRGAGNRTSVAFITGGEDDTGYHTGALTRRVGVGVGVKLQGGRQGDKHHPHHKGGTDLRMQSHLGAVIYREAEGVRGIHAAGLQTESRMLRDHVIA